MTNLTNNTANLFAATLVINHLKRDWKTASADFQANFTNWVAAGRPEHSWDLVEQFRQIAQECFWKYMGAVR